MNLPEQAFELQGACNCGACRFLASIPALAQRDICPSSISKSLQASNQRLPLCVTDHSDDSRRVTGSTVPVGIITNVSWVATKCILRDNVEGFVRTPAGESFDPNGKTRLNTFLNVYGDSAERLHWFCSRCGTSMADTIQDAKGSPKSDCGLLEIWMGCLERKDIEKEYMVPKIQLNKEQGIPWVRNLVRNQPWSAPDPPTIGYTATTQVPRTIKQVLEHSRTHLQRIKPQETLAELKEQSLESPVILVDIRPAAQREREGMIGGALVIERNVLEWRLDPKSDARLSFADRPGLRVIVFCQEGYTSSLAAYALRELGLDATDMIGGYRAWNEAGLPEQLPAAS